MKHLVFATIVMACLVLPTGCKERKSSSKGGGRKANPDSVSSTRLAASGTTAGASSTTNQTVPEAVDPADSAPVALVPLGDEAQQQASNLGKVRQELGRLVEKAIETKSRLLRAKLDNAGHQHETEEATDGNQ